MRLIPLTAMTGAALLLAATASAAGLFSRKHDTTAPPPDSGAQPQNMDCSQVASMPYGGMSVEQCEAMKRMATGAQAATNDPAGFRPGDEKLSCADIQAEMRGMQGVGPSAEHVRQGEQATADFKRTVAKQQAEATAVAAKESAEVTAAAAADAAVGVATGGLVQGRSAYVVQERQQRENKVVGDRMAKEMAPKQQAVFGAVVDSGSDMTQSMQSNPRFARLIKLAGDKGCH